MSVTIKKVENCVWKYPFPIRDEFDLELPQWATALCVRLQDNCPCLWALVNPDGPKEKRRFRLVGTGHRHPAKHFNGRYVDTLFVDAGTRLVASSEGELAESGDPGVVTSDLVFHLFEVDE